MQKYQTDRVELINNIFINLARYDVSYDFFNNDKDLMILYQSYRKIIEKVYEKESNLVQNSRTINENKDEYFYERGITIFKQNRTDLENTNNKTYKHILNIIDNDSIMDHYNPLLSNNFVDIFIKTKKNKKKIKENKLRIINIFKIAEEKMKIDKNIELCGGEPSKSLSTSECMDVIFVKYDYY